MRSTQLLIFFVLLVAAPAAGALTPPQTVSPGSTEGPVGAVSACTPMSWTLVEGADGYELAVFPVPEPTEGAAGADPEALSWTVSGELGDPALRLSLPGGASFWQPAAHQCLEPGVRYVWSVRAHGEEGWTDWSQPAFFTTPGRWLHPPPPSAPVPAEGAPEPAGGTVTPAALSVNGIVESTLDGFRFPDGSEQKKAVTREIYHAVVRADGTLLAGNVSSVTKPSNGIYQITLPRLGIACAVSGLAGIYDPPELIVLPKVLLIPTVDPSSFTISITALSIDTNTAVDTTFFAVIVCPPFVLFF